MNALRTALYSLLLLILSAPLMAQGTYTQIDVPGSLATICSGIDSNGDIVGFYADDTTLHGFLLSAGVYTTIDYPGAAETTLRGVNDAGKIVGFTLPGDRIPLRCFNTVLYRDQLPKRAGYVSLRHQRFGNDCRYLF